MTKDNFQIFKFSNFQIQKTAFLTVVVVYLLILIGGIVRSTGSGMGCPDWPKCFGMWVPPTEISQLPENYQEIFGAKLKGEVEFNALKTWIEYLNRLFGVLTGIFIFANLIAAVPYLRKDKPVFYNSLLAFLLVGFQGWLGSKVVSSELATYMVTLHMILALIIVFILLYVMARTNEKYLNVELFENKKQINTWLWAVFGLSILQIVLGTQVREAIDDIAKSLGGNARNHWVENLGLTFYIHRSFSLLILVAHVGLVWFWNKNRQASGTISKLANGLMAVVVAEVLTGVVLAYLGMPAFAQPIHLTLACVAVGIQFVLILLINQKNDSSITN